MNYTQLMAWNGGGAGNLSDIVDKGDYSPQATFEIEEVVAEHLSEIDVQLGIVEESFEEAKDSFVKDFKKSQSTAEKKAQKIRGKITDLVAEELREFFEDVQ